MSARVSDGVWFSLMRRFSQNSVKVRRREHVAGRSLLPLAFLVGTALLAPPAQADAAGGPAHASVDRSGELRVNNGMTLRLNADLGDVRIETLPANAAPSVRYTVHVETDAVGPLAQRLLGAYTLTTRETVDTVLISGVLPNPHQFTAPHHIPTKTAQFWVHFVITVPSVFDLDISTGAGEIATGDISGRVVLFSQGGDISAGRIMPLGPQNPHGDRLVAKIVTEAGGHITLKDVGGDVDAYTGGGHILAGNIDGNAKLITGGGNIRAARIKGTANLQTAGGNIAVGEAGSYVGVHTAGGQIDFGEVHGSVHAQTGGGGIRMMYVSGPMEVVTSGGSICLTRVANAIHAETGEGKITAWINPEENERGRMRLPGPSQLASRTGDIVVFLPRNISMTIDATIDTGGPARIEADPSLPLNIQARPDGPVHAMATLNGGGAPLKLHTTGGKIELQFLDAQTSLHQSLVDEQRQRLAEKFNDNGFMPVSLSPTASAPGAAQPSAPLLPSGDWFDIAKTRLRVIFMGSLREDAKDFKKRLTVAPVPEYPPLARKAGIQGLVVLEVRLRTDGSVTVDKVVEGEPSLTDAAVTAVRKWRATPEQIAGKNVEVVSTLTFDFQIPK
jgi:TonB family protein